MITEVLLSLGLMVLMGLLFSKLAKATHIPNVTGYLFAGILLGPALWSFLIPDGSIVSSDLIESIKLMADLVLGFVAFTVGVEFKLSYFKLVGSKPIIIAFLESFFAVFFIATVLILFGFPLPFSIMLGAIGGATAPAATIMTIRQYKAEGDLSKTVLSVVAIDDASTIIFFGFSVAIVQGLINPQSELWLAILMPFIEIISSLLLGAIFGFILTLLTRWFTGRGNRISAVVASVLLLLGLINVINQSFHIELSSLLAAMALGAIYTNTSKVVDTVMPLVDRFTPPLIIIFFVMSGADLRLENLTLIGVGILVIYLVFRMLGKLFGTWLGGKISHASPVVQKYLGFGLMPQGGIAIGLSLVAMDIIPITYEYNGMVIRVVVIAAVFISELFGPSLLRYALIKSGEAKVL